MSSPISPNGVGIVINGGADTGTANAYVIPVPTGTMGTPPALAVGQILVFTAANSNNGSSTRNAGGTGATAVVGQFGGALVGGEIVKTDITTVRFNGTNWQIINQSSPFTRTPAEIAAGVTPSNYSYPPGSPRRFGAVGNGTTNDTTAVQNAINTSPNFIGYPGDIYGVTTVTFPGNQVVNFNGASIRGISETATTAAVVIQGNFSNYFDYSVNLTGINGNPTPNPNYTCATWWSNNAGTQFNSIFGCYHTNAVRGMVYGQLPGNAATQTIQSENKIFGWQTTAVSNPFFQNSGQGFIHFSNPIFFRDNTGWTGAPALASTAASIENEVGQLFVEGGEIVFSSSTVGNGCVLNDCTIVGAYWEGACPVLIVGGNVQIIGGNYLMDPGGQSAFALQAGLVQVIGESGKNSQTGLVITDMVLRRESGTGATDNTCMIDASAAGAFRVELNNTSSFEWAWRLLEGNAQLVKPNTAGTTVAVYNHHRLTITASDPNVYVITSPQKSLLADTQVSHMGYATTGWFLGIPSAADGTLTVSSAAGPPGYLASQLKLNITADTEAAVTTLDGNSLAGVQASALHVRPGELYWVSGWLQLAAGPGVQLGASFSTLTASAPATPFVAVADQVSIGEGEWSFVQGPVVVPAGAAYMAIGIQTVNNAPATILFTDLRVTRAS